MFSASGGIASPGMSTRQKIAGIISLLVGLYLAAQGVHAVVAAALGWTEGTDAAPEVGYWLGVPLLVIAGLLLSYAVRLWVRSRRWSHGEARRRDL
jgi:membrane protein implicated in regulation of membrane protease activity